MFATLAVSPREGWWGSVLLVKACPLGASTLKPNPRGNGGVLFCWWKAALPARQHSVRRRLYLTLVGIFVICFFKTAYKRTTTLPIDEPFSVNGSKFVVFVAGRALAAA